MIHCNNFCSFGIPHPFGMQMLERSLTNTGEGYRFGFNGMEQDDEVSGNGNSMDFGARIYNSRIGRWFSLDPLMKKYLDVSPYCFAINDPIKFIDSDGRSIKPGKGWKGSKHEKVHTKMLNENEVFQSVYKPLAESTDIEITLYAIKLSPSIGGHCPPPSDGKTSIQMNTNYIIDDEKQPHLARNGRKKRVEDLATGTPDAFIMYGEGENKPSYYVFIDNHLGMAIDQFHEYLHSTMHSEGKITNAADQHNEMTNNDYLTLMKSFITEYAADNSFVLEPDEVEALAYMGLGETDEFKSYLAKKAGVDANYKTNLDKDSEDYKIADQKFKAAYKQWYNKVLDLRSNKVYHAKDGSIVFTAEPFIPISNDETSE